MDTIVVGVDATDDSLTALAEAARLGEQCGVGLVVVFVRHENAMVLVSSAEAVVREALDAAELSSYARSLAALAPFTMPWRFEVRHGDPSTQLCAAASQYRARAIVVGGRKHGLVGGIVAGSVAQRLVRQSTVSVLVVRSAPEILRVRSAAEATGHPHV